MNIYYHPMTGHLLAGDAQPSDAAAILDAGFEDVSTHPVFSRQLRKLRKADFPAFCKLTDDEFTPQELCAACDANGIVV